jgi:hypothetical protein
MPTRVYHRLLLMCLSIVLGLSTCGDGWATTIYSYMDEQGNLVYTDTMATIPEKYRAKVKTHERTDPVSQPQTKLQSLQQKVKDQAKNLGWHMPSPKTETGTIGASQSQILNYVGIAAIVLLLVMYMSKNSPMIRLLALGLLIVLGIGTPVLLYTSESGPMDTLTKQATTSGQAQYDRLKQVPQ